MTEQYRYLAYHDEYGITIRPIRTMPNNVYTADQLHAEYPGRGLLSIPISPGSTGWIMEKQEKDDLFVMETDDIHLQRSRKNSSKGGSSSSRTAIGLRGTSTRWICI